MGRRVWYSRPVERRADVEQGERGGVVRPVGKDEGRGGNVAGSVGGWAGFVSGGVFECYCFGGGGEAEVDGNVKRTAA